MNREWLFENENPEGRASVVLKAPSKGSPDDGAAWLSAGAVHQVQGEVATAPWVTLHKFGWLSRERYWRI